MSPSLAMPLFLAVVVAVAAPEPGVFAVLVLGALLNAGVRAVMPGKRGEA